MLKVVTGRFHPHLESALVDHVRVAKAADPFAPLAVLVPSKPLAHRVSRLLAIEQRLSLLNIHILTFHQLALRLSAEAREQPGLGPFPQVVEDIVCEQLVRHVVRSRLSSLLPLEHVGHSSGTWSALWSTVRDLKDAGVDPDAALSAVEERCFGDEDRTWLQAVFSLHAAVQEAGKTLEVGTADDLAGSLTSFVPQSRFVGALTHALYYGFYDLTQVQLSFFEAVSRTAPTTLFFPFDDSPSFKFARRFFDRSIQPLVPGPDQIRHLSDGSPAARRPALAVRSVVGAEEELASTCRQILDLVETNGYRFQDIGVVARTLDAYRPALHAVFDRHRIPLVTTVGRPLVHEPLCKTLLQLAALPLHDFYQATVLDVVTSPLYRSARYATAQGDHIRPDLWKLIVPALHITRGLAEWERLAAPCPPALASEGEAEHYQIGPTTVPAEVMRLLWQIVSELFAESTALPVRGTAARLAGALKELAERHLVRPAADDLDEDEHLTRVWEQLDGVFLTLAQLEVIGDEMPWAEFVELLTHVVERTTVPLERVEHQGVAVLDVMAARGLPFKALFVLGINEKVFPRFIREDPFLRDRHRRVLADTLGFKIDEKLAGYQEEALLLALVQQAATDRLYLSYQRADEQGRVLTASPYILEAARMCGHEEPAEDSVPRRLTDRVAGRPSIRTFLPPADLAQWLAMEGQDAAGFLQAVGRDAESFRYGVTALDRIEDDHSTLTTHDGEAGPLEDHWKRILERGLAPTPLERYARCPFQYFAADVLRLQPVRRAAAAELDAALVGTVCHAALRRCYEQLLPMGWPTEPVTDDTIEWCIYNAVGEAAAESEAAYRTGHYLLWELAKDMLIEVVSAAVEADSAAQAVDAFVPVAFEVEATGWLPPLAEGAPPLKIHGRVDRVDRRPGTDQLRIVDYKFKIGSSAKPEDRDLLQAAARGYRLQPPMYACLDIPGQPRPTQVQLFFLAPHWPTPIVRSTFESALWSSAHGSRLRETLQSLVEGIRAGRFFIVPDTYCDTCDFRVSCRRDHQATWWRAYRAPESRALKSLRVLKVKDE